MNAEIDEKYHLPEDMNEFDLFIGIHGSNKERWISRQVRRFSHTGENLLQNKSTSRGGESNEIESEFDIRDYTGRLLAVRMPGKKVVDRIEAQRNRSCTDVGGLHVC